jgi:hypothetical protein
MSPAAILNEARDAGATLWLDSHATAVHRRFGRSCNFFKGLGNS